MSHVPGRPGHNQGMDPGFRFVPQLRPPQGAEGDSLWFLVRGGEVRITEGDPPTELLAAADGWHFLGCLDGRPCWGAGIPDRVEVEGFVPLRSLYTDLDEIVWTVAGRAVQLVEWERTHRYCGKCGTGTHEDAGDRARKCSACGHVAFPRLTPAIITVVRRADELLLARNRRFPAGLFSAVAGFVEPGETLEDAVRREVNEEVGVRVGEVRYYGSQPWPFPHSLMIGFIAHWEDGEIRCDESEIVEAGWFRPDALPRVPSRMSIARRLIDAVAEELHGGP